MKIGALFAGYGGLDIATERVFGATTAWVSEFDKAPSRILAQRFPDAPNVGDVTEVDWSAVEPVDIITGGSPCQDLSHAGKRAGMKAGTRSGLWASMCDAIETIRPRFVVWENVRGAYSAAADSSVVADTGRVDRRGRPVPALRALGRVLGDLAEIGYDACWTGLRAADVGAPHGRFRVFVLAWDAAAEPAHVGHERPRPAWDGRAGLADDHRRTGNLTLLPTPAVNDMGAGKTVDAWDAWDAWTDRMRASHGNGNGHGNSLHIEALRMLPTPTATDHKASGATYAATHHAGTTLTDATVRNPAINPDRRNDALPAEDRPGEDLRGVRHVDDSAPVRREARGSDALPGPSVLLEELREHEVRGDEGCASLARQEAPGGDLFGVPGDDGLACASRRPEPGEQRPDEPADAMRVMPPAAALAGGPGEACGCDAWGDVYGPAIHRWEMVTGRVAPRPTEPTGKGGAHRLSARAVEWMMGLPDGWVTDTDTTRNAQLKALGNGVVPQQAEAALWHLLNIYKAR